MPAEFNVQIDAEHNLLIDAQASIIEETQYFYFWAIIISRTSHDSKMLRQAWGSSLICVPVKVGLFNAKIQDVYDGYTQ